MIKTTDKNLAFLITLFSACLIISNVLASLVVNTGFKLFGNNITIPAAVICYPLTFLITDIIGELWGKEEAAYTVKVGFIVQILAAILIFIAGRLNYVSQDMRNSYNVLLSGNYYFVIASLLAFLVSQNIDVFIFHSLKKYNNNEKKWIRNNLSTMTSQLFDTIIFIVIAFGVGFRWLFDPNMRMTLLFMIIGQYMIKLIFALLDTPFFYLATYRSYILTKKNLKGERS